MPLKIVVPETELFDNTTMMFIPVPQKELRLEHSLVSVSKWEAKWKKPFLGKDQMTDEQTRDYIRCMTITQCVDPNVYKALTQQNIQEVMAYINDPMTATWFNKQKATGAFRVITSEVLYWQMIALGIPFECQTWHLNRLLTLIKICSEKNKPSKKMSRQEIAQRNRNLNAARRAKLGTRG